VCACACAHERAPAGFACCACFPAGSPCVNEALPDFAHFGEEACTLAGTLARLHARTHACMPCLCTHAREVVAHLGAAGGRWCRPVGVLGRRRRQDLSMAWHGHASRCAGAHSSAGAHALRTGDSRVACALALQEGLREGGGVCTSVSAIRGAMCTLRLCVCCGHPAHLKRGCRPLHCA